MLCRSTAGVRVGFFARREKTVGSVEYVFNHAIVLHDQIIMCGVLEWRNVPVVSDVGHATMPPDSRLLRDRDTCDET